MDRLGHAFAMILLLAVLVSCGGVPAASQAPTRPATTSDTRDIGTTPGVATTPFPSSDEPVAVGAGTYRIPASMWSTVDFTVTIPEGWGVQYGHVYLKHGDTDEEFGFYAVVVDAIRRCM